MNIEDYKIKIHNKILNLRNIQHLLDTQMFKIAYSRNEEHNQLLTILNLEDIHLLRKWIKNRIYGNDLRNLPVAELKQIAAKRKIKNYSRKTRSVLLKELSNGT